MKSITLTREEKMEDEDEEYARLYQEFRDILAKEKIDRYEDLVNRKEVTK